MLNTTVMGSRFVLSQIVKSCRSKIVDIIACNNNVCSYTFTSPTQLNRKQVPTLTVVPPAPVEAPVDYKTAVQIASSG